MIPQLPRVYPVVAKVPMVQNAGNTFNFTPAYVDLKFIIESLPIQYANKWESYPHWFKAEPTHLWNPLGWIYLCKNFLF